MVSCTENRKKLYFRAKPVSKHYYLSIYQYIKQRTILHKTAYYFKNCVQNVFFYQKVRKVRKSAKIVLYIYISDYHIFICIENE